MIRFNTFSVSISVMSTVNTVLIGGKVTVITVDKQIHFNLYEDDLDYIIMVNCRLPMAGTLIDSCIRVI